MSLRRIISNISTATYELANYLAQILKPLGQSQYTIKKSKLFIKTLKKQKISLGYQRVSFDVVSLFTDVPLEETINVIIKRIYDKNETNIDIPKQEMKELLYLCTKNAHFTLNSKTYVQIDGIAMGSPLVPALANIFMVEFEQNIIPTLSEDYNWNRKRKQNCIFRHIINALQRFNQYYCVSQENKSFSQTTENGENLKP